MSEYRLVMKGVVKTFPGVKEMDEGEIEYEGEKVTIPNPL